MEHFNQAASTWDTPEKVQTAQKFKNRISSYVPSSSPLRILEVGCGTGLLGEQFLAEKNTLLGIDTSTGMLEVFNQKFAGNDRVKSLLWNLEESDLAEKGFDLVISSMAFHHLKNPSQVVHKLKSLLSPTGIIAIIDLETEDGSFHPDPKKMGVQHFGFSEQETKEWGVKAGFYGIHREVVNTIHKNNKTYSQFLAIYSHEPLKQT